MKKVILFCDYFGDGGIEKIITFIKKNIPNKDYKISILTTFTDSYLYQDCISISKIKSKNPFLRFLMTILNIRRYANDADIVHVNLHSSIELCYACLLNKKKKIIVHAHNSNFERNPLKIKNFINKIFQVLFNRRRFIYLACSQEASDFCFGKNIESIIIDNKLDGNKFVFNLSVRNKMREEYKISKDTYVLGHVGRFTPQKNQKFLIKIFYEFQKKNANSILFMIGSGSLQPEVINLANRYGIAKKIIILEYTKSIDKYYQMFDAFVFPSLFEGYGICVYEALCASLRCFISATISQNFDKNDNIISISLKEDASYWANKIYENRNYSRFPQKIKGSFIECIKSIYSSYHEKISIIVPFYNAENTIKRCIDSILKQTYFNYELILVDDGSTDGSVEIIRQYKDARLKLIQQKNAGTGSARNTGIRNSTGLYYLFVDSDDEIVDSYLEVMNRIRYQYQCDIVCSSVSSFKKKRVKIIHSSDALSLLFDLPETIGMSVTRKLFKKEIVDTLFFDENNNFEDVPFAIEAFSKAKRVGFINKQFYICHVRENSRSSFYEGNDRIIACLSSYYKIATFYPNLFNKYISYSLFNMIGVVNAMILHNQYNTEILNEIHCYMNKYIQYVIKTNYPLYKKLQIYLFHFHFSFYQKVYMFLRRSSSD